MNPLVITSALWLDQRPGREQVGGLCLLRLPERTVELARFEHPVDVHPAAFRQAEELALQDVPEPQECQELHGAKGPRDPEWMLLGDECEPFVAPVDLWSRVRRVHPRQRPDGTLGLWQTEVLLEWEAGALEPRVSGDESYRGHRLAWSQAHWVARLLMTPCMGR